MAKAPDPSKDKDFNDALKKALKMPPMPHKPKTPLKAAKKRAKKKTASKRKPT